MSSQPRSDADPVGNQDPDRTPGTPPDRSTDSPTDPAPDPALDPATGLPVARLVRRERVSLVWLLPVLALLIGVWLAWKTINERGPVVTIEFRTASGLQAGKTKVKFKDVDVGQVTAIRVGPDLDRVIVTAELTRDAEEYLHERTRFWVARPQVTASRVSGLETLLSGAYVAIDPVRDGRSERHFVGLESPPVISTDEAGTHYRLRAPTLGSLNLGSPVYFRHIQVGQVIDYTLDDDGAAVTIDVFIAAPQDRLVYANTRFWNASGISARLGAEGVSLDTESLLAVLIGGVGFDTPAQIEQAGAPAPANAIFPLYTNRDAAEQRIYLEKQKFLLYFSGAVRGLSVGAPVLLRGIQVGEVLDVQLQYDPARTDFVIPVLIEIEPERIGLFGSSESVHATPAKLDILKQLIAAGLRGQLKTGSLLTGQLYIEFDFHPEAAPATVVTGGDYPVLPTVPTALDALTSRVSAVLTEIERLPLAQIGDDLAGTLAAARGLVSSSELKGAISELEQTLAQVRALTAQVDRELAPQLTATVTEARAAIATLDRNLNGLIGPSATLTVEATRTMREVSAAARSLRVFADYLERHPEALIQGKGGRR